MGICCKVSIVWNCCELGVVGNWCQVLELLGTPVDCGELLASVEESRIVSNCW